MKLKCAILDDYQQVALGMADWSAIADRVEVSAMSQHFTDEAELAVHLQDCDILVIMRERTPITASLLVRLPKLKLVITSGMRNASVDLAAAAAWRCGLRYRQRFGRADGADLGAVAWAGEAYRAGKRRTA